MESSLLTGWENFFVITGSAAGGLTGLTFIVITLSAAAGRTHSHGMRVFITPTIVHFSAVLGLSAYLTMPRQTSLSVSLGLGVVGVAGLAYIATIANGIRLLSNTYVPAREDWIWNALLPAIAYAATLVSACLIGGWPQGSVYAVAGALILLILIGIHNAWDIAVWNSTERPTAQAAEQPMSQTAGQAQAASPSQPMSQPAAHATAQSPSQPMSQPAAHATAQSPSQPMIQPEGEREKLPMNQQAQ